MRTEYDKLKEIQRKLYTILREVDRVCKENNISYYMVYGTLLGAVRHQACIPWDNDIDIAMTRENFKKFLHVQEKLGKDYKLEHICYSNIQYASLSRVQYNGTHVDIFIMDHAKKYKGILAKIIGGLGRFLQIAKLSQFEKEILYKHFKDKKKKLLVVHFGAVLNKVFSSAIIEKWNYYLLVSKKETGSLVIIEDPHRLMDIKWFETFVFLQYETMNFPAPVGYKKVLSLWYGNYMEIPPEGKRYLELFPM